MLTAEGALRPIDFEGAARLHSRVNSPWGTAGYLPPEWRDTTHADPAQDVHALAVMIHQIFTRILPAPNMPLTRIVDARPALPPAIDALLSAMTAIRNNWVDDRNIKIAARPKLLVIPTALEPVAARLLMSDLRPGTAMNDVNAIRHIMGGLRDYMVDEFLTSNYAWFVKTDKDGLVYYDRIPFEMDMYVDFDTDNLKVKGRERYVFSYTDWRSVYGSFPTS